MRVIINCIVILLYFILVCCFWSAVIEIILKKSHTITENQLVSPFRLYYTSYIWDKFNSLQWYSIKIWFHLCETRILLAEVCHVVFVTSLYMTGEWARWSFMHYQIYTQIASEFEIFIPKKINVNDQWSRYLSEFAFEIICMQWCDSRIIKTNTKHLWKYIEKLIIFQFLNYF